MQYAAWNKSTIVDILVLILKVIVAAALIGHAHHIKGEIQPEPVYGVLDDPTYAYSAEAATDMLVRVSWIAGGYVMVASAIGLIGRCLHAAPLYGVYYCANIFGFAVCLTAAIIPTVWGTTRKGLCLAAEASCLAVEDLSLCPYPVSSFATQTRQRVLADPTEGVSGAEGAVTMASSSPCCYLPSFFSFCEHFFGAVYTQTVIAVVLLALVMTQSMISCCYLCCDCDRRKYFVWDWEPAKLPVCSSSLLSCVLAWTSKGRLPDIPELPTFVPPGGLPGRFSLHKGGEPMKPGRDSQAVKGRRRTREGGRRLSSLDKAGPAVQERGEGEDSAEGGAGGKGSRCAEERKEDSKG
ncbi:hypothetical protein NSK_003911 [Nannochloropsis salina CCMP1776]|uniref:Uncharacterized protein n=1 Tax=Nannochloropsis salina CCMP1776 TaxID=1027361 RepID=A0A4D9D8F1_9STRA|nr:hypothetical protein NSK_003911 [Nannochloropsis salina CCMP1776]|eukprot:TFJ84879.1 hypothetical protein NSK_003911 [Nannochloropsis salina CCMP1776]